MNFEQKFNIFKSCKNSYTRPLCTTDLEYGGHEQEIQSFVQFLPQTWDFQKNHRQAPIDFEQKIKKIQNQKKTHIQNHYV
jgi:hypothetical protein